MEAANWIVMEDGGRESPPTDVISLYRRAQDGQLWHDTMLFDLEKREWVRAEQIPALRAIFTRQATTANPTPPPPAQKPALTPETPTLWQRIFGRH